MPTWSGKLAAAGLAVLALSGAVACGGTSVDEVEDQVGSEMKAQFERQSRLQGGGDGSGTRVDHVDCPDDVDTGEGSMFRCRALDAQDKVVGTVTIQMRGEGKAMWQFVAIAPQ